MATKNKMSNEGQTAKVPLGKSIGLVFVIGLVVGCIVVFLAVAGRTQSIVAERREILKDKLHKEAVLKAGPDAIGPVDPSLSPAPIPVPTDGAQPSGGNVVP
ncbi:MAG: hypothetical protein H7318_10140 [Oligoflexus sp.]|nr:hypothetical protein [Oligoflexus sp.]